MLAVAYVHGRRQPIKSQQKRKNRKRKCRRILRMRRPGKSQVSPPASLSEVTPGARKSSAGPPAAATRQLDHVYPLTSSGSGLLRWRSGGRLKHSFTWKRSYFIDVFDLVKRVFQEMWANFGIYFKPLLCGLCYKKSPKEPLFYYEHSQSTKSTKGSACISDFYASPGFDLSTEQTQPRGVVVKRGKNVMFTPDKTFILLTIGGSLLLRQFWSSKDGYPRWY